MVKRESNNYSKIIISDSKNEKLKKKVGKYITYYY